jgi:hypothetical protein
VKTLEDFWHDQAEWSQATFGSDAERGPVGALKHLEKEAREAVADEHKLGRAYEIVDCLFLVFDAARRHGMDYELLVDMAFTKLWINKSRKWAKPSNGDEPVEHDRTGEGK